MTRGSAELIARHSLSYCYFELRTSGRGLLSALTRYIESLHVGVGYVAVSRQCPSEVTTPVLALLQLEPLAGQLP